MKKAGMRLLIAAMIITGCCCLLYPVYTNLVFRYYSDESRKEYEEAAAQKDAAYKEEAYAKARIYNASLSTTSLLDPFSGGSNAEADYQSYLDTLDITTVNGIDGVMGISRSRKSASSFRYSTEPPTRYYTKGPGIWSGRVFRWGARELTRCLRDIRD